ncbi:hypothetical protein IWQ47_002151 [Aquimarina sp. EL_43]|uniref:lipocalin family protein n=1 Tax=unclassified Aquimarina TaxID=2627091 RepID=UPI0018CAE6CE|nr:MULTISPECIES: lipocalin family protein [unclassified Aquimarina]MBG6130675.1 hypothetical protein [Aquimarina sp. EL_35]MBG6151179.1 hypothetical protein [Aquimarina sp. EL_32]MBG6169077.1 hypothetical protein [Aquimarina sp. EL_43]
MKKIFLATFILSLVISCGSKSNTKSIEGKWLLVDVGYEMDDANEQLKGFVESIKNAIVGKISFEFKEENVFIASLSGKKKTEGTWSISEDGKTITTTDGRKTEDMTIISIDSNKLVVSKKSPQGDDTIWTFNKE